ncbi:MAG: sulfite exporter TauE/SafE [Planctomycetota bacterium]|jgi:sulfite exporter TauE/SafE
MSVYLPFLGLALLGAGHCAGMCGPFVVLLNGHHRGWRLLGRQQLFVTGKALTYAILATLLARLAGGVVAEGESMAKLRNGLAWASGLVLIAHGFTCLGLPVRFVPRLPLKLAVHASRIKGAFTGMSKLPGYAGPLGAGLAAGLLPCGLSWSALLLAAAMPPLQAAAAMLTFGLATGPALIAVGFSWRWLSQSKRRLVGVVFGPLLILFGVLTVARGGLPQGADQALLPDCCETSETS